MDINECIRLSALLTCPPFESSQEEGNDKAILVQKKLKEIAYHKALSNRTDLSQLNPIKNPDYDFDLPSVLTEGPWEKEHWHREVDQNYCYNDLATFWEEAGKMRPFYLLGTIATSSFCDIAFLTDEDIEAYIDNYKDWFLEFMDSEESIAFLADEAIELLKEICKTEEKGCTENDLINELIHEINSQHLHGMCTYSSICQNLVNTSWLSTLMENIMLRSLPWQIHFCRVTCAMQPLFLTQRKNRRLNRQLRLFIPHYAIAYMVFFQLFQNRKIGLP